MIAQSSRVAAAAEIDPAPYNGGATREHVVPEPSTLTLLVGLVLALGLVQGCLIALARGLGLRLWRTAIVVGLALPAVLVASFLIRNAILLPTGVLARNLPDAPSSEAAEHYTVLNDAVYQFVPWEAEVRRALRSRRLPIWSERIDGGSSPWLNPQAGVLSPIAAVVRVVPLEHHLLAALAVKLLVAFQGAWLLARLLGSRRWVALIGGLGFALGGGIMAWSLFPHSATAAWMPWLTAGAIRTARRPGAATIASTAAITAAMVLSGHPETVLGGGILAAAGATCFSRRSRGRTGAVRGASAALAAALLGFAIAAPQALPFARHLPHTVRYQRLAKSPGDQSSTPLRLVDRQRANFLKSTVSPQPYGQWPYSEKPFLPLGGGGYAGLVALAGSCLALAFGIRRCLPFAACGLLIGSLIAELGPVIAVADRLPLAQTVGWTRLITTLPLCLAICGSVGLSALLRRPRPSALTAVAAAAGVSLLVSPKPAIALLWGVLALALAAALRRPRLGTVMVLAVAIADLVPWAHAMLPYGDPALFYPDTGFMAAVQRERAASGHPRAIGLGLSVYPSMLSLYGAPDIRYHNPVADHRYAQVLDATLGFHPEARPYQYFSPVTRLPPAVDFLNLGLVIAGTRELPDRFLEVAVDTTGRRRLFRNREVVPRAFIPTGGRVVDRDETLKATAAIVDPRTVVVSRTDAAGRRVPETDWRPDLVGWLDDGFGRVTLEVAGNGTRLVATSLSQPAGWSASAAGRQLETITLNHAFLGVVVPASANLVDLRYRPEGLVAGVVIGVLGLAFLLGLVVLAVRRARTDGRRRGSRASRSRSRSGIEA